MSNILVLVEENKKDTLRAFLKSSIHSYVYLSDMFSENEEKDLTLDKAFSSFDRFLIVLSPEMANDPLLCTFVYRIVEANITKEKQMITCACSEQDWKDTPFVVLRAYVPARLYKTAFDKDLELTLQRRLQELDAVFGK